MEIDFLSAKDTKKVERLSKKQPPQPEKGYEDIFKPIPYLTDDMVEDTAYVDQIFVPASLRGHGLGTSMFHNWFNALPENITQIRLVAVDGVSGCTLKFYEAFGFKPAYTCPEGIDDEHTSRILTLGVNGHKTVEPETLAKGQTAHYLFGVEH